MQKYKPLLIKLIKFGMVGFTGIFIDYGITILLKEVLDFNQYIANSIGFIVAASSNYLLNRIWTFQSKNPKIAKEYTIFVVISIIGLLLSNIIIWIFNDAVYSIDFYISKFFAIVIVFLWNFGMNHFFNFKESHQINDFEE